MFLSKKPIRLQQHIDTGQELTETGHFPVFDCPVSGGSCLTGEATHEIFWAHLPHRSMFCGFWYAFLLTLIVKRNYYSTYYRLPVSSGHLSLTQTSGKPWYQQPCHDQFHSFTWTKALDLYPVWFCAAVTWLADSITAWRCTGVPIKVNSDSHCVIIIILGESNDIKYKYLTKKHANLLCRLWKENVCIYLLCIYKAPLLKVYLFIHLWLFHFYRDHVKTGVSLGLSRQLFNHEFLMKKNKQETRSICYNELFIHS